MEQVFTLPSAVVEAIVPKGVVAISEEQFLEFVTRHGRFYDRTPALESNTTLRQVIPYITVTHGGRVLVYQRTPKQTDKRLHAKYSIGFGGHINPVDGKGGKNPILGARARELNEEISFAANLRFRFLGTINVIKEPVDEFHVGVAYVAEAGSDDFRINEVGYFASTAWKTPAEAAALLPLMESWSQEVFAVMYPKETKAAKAAAATKTE